MLNGILEADNTPATEQNAVMVGLLDACVKNLQSQGMRKMFIDGVAGEVGSFKQLGKFLEFSATGYIGLTVKGFVEWAKYQDVWRDT